MKEEPRIRCSRCCVGYVVAGKPYRAPVYRCRDCGIQFWEAPIELDRGAGLTRSFTLGITKADYGQWLGGDL